MSESEVSILPSRSLRVNFKLYKTENSWTFLLHSFFFFNRFVWITDLKKRGGCQSFNNKKLGHAEDISSVLLYAHVIRNPYWEHLGVTGEKDSILVRTVFTMFTYLFYSYTGLLQVSFTERERELWFNKVCVMLSNVC